MLEQAPDSAPVRIGEVIAAITESHEKPHGEDGHSGDDLAHCRWVMNCAREQYEAVKPALDRLADSRGERIWIGAKP